MPSTPKKIVLAYSGGLDTSAIIPWLIEQYQCEVYAFVADVGQNPDELVGVQDKAIASGATDCCVKDLKHAITKDYIFPMVKLGASYENGYLLGTAIARPIIAKAQVEYALSVGADSLSHGCTGKGNDQIRFETVYAALAPELNVIAPWRIWQMQSREDLLAYIGSKGIPCAVNKEKQYSRDENLWHLSHEGAELEDPWNAPKASMWQLTANIDQTPDEKLTLSLCFCEGLPTSINGVDYSPYELVNQLNVLAGKHGVGRIDIVESRTIGMKSRGCYETPAGTVIMKALASLEELVLDRDSLAFKKQVAAQFGQLLYDGKWFTPLMKTLLSVADNLGENLTGEVVVELYKGTVTVSQRRAELSLYDEGYATFDNDDVYEQSDASGFIKLFSLPSRIQSLKQGGVD